MQELDNRTCPSTVEVQASSSEDSRLLCVSSRLWLAIVGVRARHLSVSAVPISVPLSMSGTTDLARKAVLLLAVEPLVQVPAISDR